MEAILKSKQPKQSAKANIYQTIQKRAKALEGETVRILSDLVRTQSFSSKEKDVIEVIRKEMKAAGFDEVRVDGLGNIIGRIGNGKRSIAFDAHIDTVYPGDLDAWSFDPFTPKVQDGKIWGRGT
ncbi:MAG: M20/M25/M40 family metallo-hydrolase, partial [Limisphaerales bacterium]